tara:strand:+ start:170 stop:805 length:636 start_codon:yes stop_codon:yes gene_type:complete
MTSQLGYSDFSSDENLLNSGNNHNNRNGGERSSIARKRRTIKRREAFNNEDKKESPLKLTKAALLTGVDDDDDQQEGLADFTSDFSPPPRSELTQQRENNEEEQNFSSELPKQSEGDSSLNTETYEGMSGGYAENYVNQFVPYYQNAANVVTGSNNNSDIAEKLNYLINLIEEQKDEKVGHVAEELILYSFLGVFVIYIVDSFARVGKYVR